MNKKEIIRDAVINIIGNDDITLYELYTRLDTIIEYLYYHHSGITNKNMGDILDGESGFNIQISNKLTYSTAHFIQILDKDIDKIINNLRILKLKTIKK